MRILNFVLILAMMGMQACAQKEYEYAEVDLGLSVKWAIHNIGAELASDYGTYYAWGELESKTRFWFDTYKFTDSDECEQCVIDLGPSICGTEYDVARQTWKGGWRLPTDQEILELRNNCKWEWTSLDGINGFMITGPNGNSMFLPAGGEIRGEKNDEFGQLCSYWSGTKSFVRNAFTINAYVDEDDGTISVKCWGDYKPLGRLVRPVKE